jgi:hypothetical protein
MQIQVTQYSGSDSSVNLFIVVTTNMNIILGLTPVADK